MAASGSVGRGSRLLPHRDTPPACGAPTRMPHRRWHGHGALAGGRSLPLVHGDRGRCRAHASMVRPARGAAMTIPASGAADSARDTRLATASGWIGSVLEYYDFFIYATAASLVFPQLFFPSGNPTVAIVASLATYGVGYVSRPIGAFVLG